MSIDYDLVAQIEQFLDWDIIIRTTLMRKKRNRWELSFAPLPARLYQRPFAWN